MKHIETARRLREAMDDMNISAAELARLSGISKGAISQYYNGTYAPGNIKAGAMADVLGVSPVWLMGFDVPKNDAAARAEEDFNILSMYHSLSEDHRELVYNLLEALSGKKAED